MSKRYLFYHTFNSFDLLYEEIEFLKTLFKFFFFLLLLLLLLIDLHGLQSKSVYTENSLFQLI